MIEAVLFDLGDTLIDFGVGRREAEILFRRGARLTYEHLAARGLRVPSFEVYFNAHYGRMRRAYVWSKVTRRDFSYAKVLGAAARALRLPLSDGDLRDLAGLWYRPICATSHTDPGVRHMLEQLRRAGTKLGIVSNTLVPAHCLDQHLEEEGLLEYFPVRVYSSAVRYRKPHARIFEMALAQIGTPASRTVFIGDLLATDIFGAKRAGMRTIWKPARNKPFAQAPDAPHRRAPDVVIPKVTYLPEALRQFGWRPTRVMRETAVA
ncbi:MAG TPA: HAD family hydrolase [Phycisphaerae bacterium]|nr:HAD family hydrolase [Phycisphaerae bacterium]